MNTPTHQSASAVVTGSSLSFRWIHDGQQHYSVTLFAHFLAPGGAIDLVNLDTAECVVDDFGNLVKVAA